MKWFTEMAKFNKNFWFGNCGNVYSMIESGYDLKQKPLMCLDVNNMLIVFKKGDEFTKLFFDITTKNYKKDIQKLIQICTKAYDRNWKSYRKNIIKLLGDERNYNQK